MVIISNITFPPESAKEIAERFLSLPDLPDYITRRGPYLTSNIHDGSVVYSIYELDKSKLADGMLFLSDYMAKFFGVPGFNYEVKVYFEVEEALASIGMG